MGDKSVNTNPAKCNSLKELNKLIMIWYLFFKVNAFLYQSSKSVISSGISRYFFKLSCSFALSIIYPKWSSNNALGTVKIWLIVLFLEPRLNNHFKWLYVSFLWTLVILSSLMILITCFGNPSTLKILPSRPPPSLFPRT